MTRLIGILVLVFFIGKINAQKISKDNVPAVVSNAFQVKFPNADKVAWRLDKGNYRVTFEVFSKDNTLTLNFKGNILKHHQDLFVSEIPEAVLATIKSKSPYFDISDADKILENGKTIYEIDFAIAGKKHYFWIEESGTLMKLRKELKESEVPTAIINMINTKYGEFDHDRSKYIEENRVAFYVIRGKINDKDHIFDIDPKAIMLKHQQDLKNSEIPVPVQNAINTTYSGYEIRDADFIEEGSKANYIIRLRKSKDDVTVYYNPEGKVLKIVD